VARTDFLSQVDHAYEAYVEKDANAVGIYNDGNFFNDSEIDHSTQLAILERVANWPGLRQITIESRPEYITGDILKEIREVCGECTVELATGIDSTNPEIIRMTTNRGLDIEKCKKKLFLAQEYGIRTTALMVFGLPFLTQREIVDDACTSIEELLKWNINVDIEAMTLQDGSFLERLHRVELYRVPWLWSLVELFRRIPDPADVYLSPFSYSVPTVETPFNCQSCSFSVASELLEKFSQSRDKADLPTYQGCCENEWRIQMGDTRSGSLQTRVNQVLDLFEARTI
jgi:hypothetical protein